MNSQNSHLLYCLLKVFVRLGTIILFLSFAGLIYNVLIFIEWRIMGSNVLEINEIFTGLFALIIALLLSHRLIGTMVRDVEQDIRRNIIIK